MILLEFVSSSIRCADQPAILAIAKIGVYSSIGMPSTHIQSRCKNQRLHKRPCLSCGVPTAVLLRFPPQSDTTEIHRASAFRSKASLQTFSKYVLLGQKRYKLHAPDHKSSRCGRSPPDSAVRSNMTESHPDCSSLLHGLSNLGIISMTFRFAPPCFGPFSEPKEAEMAE